VCNGSVLSVARNVKPVVNETGTGLCQRRLNIYRVIKKSLYTWWLRYRMLQVMFKVSTASLQTFIDTLNCVLEDRVQYSTVHIPNVFCDGHLHGTWLKLFKILYFCVFLSYNRQVHRGFLIILYIVQNVKRNSDCQEFCFSSHVKGEVSAFSCVW
jgi:hypothetical protein